MTAFTLPGDVSAVMERFGAAGFEIYCVGGCVRDAMLGKQPADFDLCTNAVPEEILSVCGEYTCIPTGIRHGTVTVLSGKRPLEITTYRVDGGYADHRRPDSVTFSSSLKEDCARRDFTVNAMAYRPEEGILDFFGGREDLKNGVIRCVGEPERRFSEDALRILRALRFSSVLGFVIGRETAEALEKLAPTLSMVAKERISAELEKLFGGIGATRVLTEFRPVFSGIFQKIPEEKTHDALARAFALEKTPYVRMGAYLYLAECENTEKTLRELTFDGNFSRKAAEIVGETAKELPKAPADIRRRLSTREMEILCAAYRLRGAVYTEEKTRADKAVRMTELCVSRGDAVRVSDLAVGGRELMKLGIGGKQIGDTLSLLLSAVMEERLPNEKQALLKAAEAMKQE